MSVLADLTARLGLLDEPAPARESLAKPHPKAANESIVPDAPEQSVEPLGYTLTAATASPEWRQARDLYLQHLTTCRACHAPTNRYCMTGSGLRQLYENTKMLSLNEN